MQEMFHSMLEFSMQGVVEAVPLLRQLDISSVGCPGIPLHLNPGNRMGNWEMLMWLDCFSTIFPYLVSQANALRVAFRILYQSILIQVGPLKHPVKGSVSTGPEFFQQCLVIKEGINAGQRNKVEESCIKAAIVASIDHWPACREHALWHRIPIFMDDPSRLFLVDIIHDLTLETCQPAKHACSQIMQPTGIGIRQKCSDTPPAPLLLPLPTGNALRQCGHLSLDGCHAPLLHRLLEACCLQSQQHSP